MSWLGQIAWVPGLHLLLTFALLLFPTGRVPSSRWRIVAWICIIPLVLFVPLALEAWSFRGRAFLEHPEQFEPSGFVNVLGNLMFPLMLLSGLACVISLIVRFRYSRGNEREQLKWIAFAAAMTLIAIVVANFLDIGEFGGLLLLPVVPSIPIAAGIAILRYRLYDIDVIINRTLVYGALTATLAVVYISVIIALQNMVQVFTGQQESQLAIVASTLTIAALFNPLRRRIQAVIDRRFYRRKYDAAQVLVAFSARLRDETDLDALSNDLLTVVEETLQPAHVSLWLREPPAQAQARQDEKKTP